MPLLLLGSLFAGGAASWYFWKEDETPEKDTNKTIRVIAILIIIILILKFFK